VPAARAISWTYEDAERYLASLEPIGWKLGLDRIRRLTSVLGMPQRRFASIHVVGTNGKSSVAEMTAALLEAHGMRAGTYLSPHVARWSERVRIGGEEIGDAEFARATKRVSESVEAVNRTLEDGEAVTQFEAMTAAAFVALAESGIDAGVIEAGLGGRLDATNVIPSRACALTSVGLEHTEWLGETVEEIAGEKLAVLRDRSTLVLGELAPEVMALARRTAAERHARVVTARPSPQLDLRARGAYQRRNFAVALATAEAILGPLDAAAARRVAADLELPGRVETIHGDPPLVLDAAHNPDGARALAEALPEVTAGRPVIGCLAVLHGKDAAGIVSALAPALDAAVCTELAPEALTGLGRPGAASIPASRLAEACAGAGLEAEAIGDARPALERARELARARSGMTLVAGSHYLLGEAWTAKPAPSSWR
jgi:dihydrofolate synthase/folylpolyglutamate synthase